MIFQSNLDFCIALVLLLLALVGFARGFLREVVSIVNWFGSFYFTSLAKPLALSLLGNRITTPFLLDIISNAVLFVFFVIVFSLANSYLVSRIRGLIPASVDRLLGLFFGSIKGLLVSMIVLASINILYRSPNVNDPLWLENSIAYRCFSGPRGSVFVEILERIFGDLLREENNPEKPDEKPKEKLDSKIEDLAKEPVEGGEGQGDEDVEPKNIEDLLREIAD